MAEVTPTIALPILRDLFHFLSQHGAGPLIVYGINIGELWVEWSLPDGVWIIDMQFETFY